MADESTTYGIAAAIAALVVAIRDIGGGVLKAMRRKRVEDKQAREEAKEENSERDQWAAINSLKDAQALHEKEDAGLHSELRTELKRTSADVAEMKSDIKTLLRRATGELPRGR